MDEVQQQISIGDSWTSREGAPAPEIARPGESRPRGPGTTMPEAAERARSQPGEAEPHPAVHLVQLTKRFGDALALDRVDVEIPAGEVFGYLGPNGAGKSTTLRLIMGLLRPSGGRAFVLGFDTWRQAGPAQRLTGYVPGDPALYPKLTGAEHIDYVSALRRTQGRPSATRLAARLDLDLSRRAGVLSKGNRQKLAIVLALMHRPKLLVLDEPSTGLDPFAREELLALIREHAGEGGTVLLSSHVLDEVQKIADRVGILRAGRLIAVERLGDLRARSLHHVSARLDDGVAAEAEFAAISGIRDLAVSGDHIEMKAPQDRLDEVVKRLAHRKVIDLECTEADLEETFTAFYGDNHDHA